MARLSSGPRSCSTAFRSWRIATQQARQAANSQQGVNLVPGDYILVPHAYTDQLTPHLDNVELRQGYLVPKGSPTNTSDHGSGAGAEAGHYLSVGDVRHQADHAGDSRSELRLPTLVGGRPNRMLPIHVVTRPMLP